MYEVKIELVISHVAKIAFVRSSSNFEKKHLDTMYVVCIYITAYIT